MRSPRASSTSSCQRHAHAPDEGLGAPREGVRVHKDAQRILLTGFSDHDDLADAVNNGHVFAYMQKPWDNSQLRLVIQRAAAQRRLELENRRLTNDLKASNARLRDDVEAVSRTASASRPRLLATSPTHAEGDGAGHGRRRHRRERAHPRRDGTGKELVARAIHDAAAARATAVRRAELRRAPARRCSRASSSATRRARSPARSTSAARPLRARRRRHALPRRDRRAAARRCRRSSCACSRSASSAASARASRVRSTCASSRRRTATSRRREAGHVPRGPLLPARRVSDRGAAAARAPRGRRAASRVPLLEAAAQRMNRELPRIGEAAWRALESHPWPGNVRELGNVIERLVIYHAGRDVEPADLGLPQSLRASLFPYNVAQPAPSEALRARVRRRPRGVASSPGPPATSRRARRERPSEPRADHRVARYPAVERARRGSPRSAGAPSDEYDLPPLSRPRLDVDAIAPGALSLDLPEGGTTFDDLEREILAQVLARADNNQSRAARSLGMSESTFRSRMKRLGLKG